MVFVHKYLVQLQKVNHTVIFIFSTSMTHLQDLTVHLFSNSQEHGVTTSHLITMLNVVMLAKDQMSYIVVSWNSKTFSPL